MLTRRTRLYPSKYPNPSVALVKDLTRASIHGPVVTRPLSRWEGTQLLLFLGKKLRHIMEVVMAEGTIGMGLVPSALCAPLLFIYNSWTCYVLPWGVHQHPHHETNTTSALLGQERPIIIVIFIPLLWHVWWCTAVHWQSYLPNNSVACCNSERVGNDYQTNGLAQCLLRVVPSCHRNQITLDASCQHPQ